MRSFPHHLTRLSPPLPFGQAEKPVDSPHPPRPAGDFSRDEALSLLALGNIQAFNAKLALWRQHHPGQYFDLREAPLSQITAGATYKQSLGLLEEELLDLRAVDLRGADFRGMKKITALISLDPETWPPGAEVLNPFEGALFSLGTEKFLT